MNSRTARRFDWFLGIIAAAALTAFSAPFLVRAQNTNYVICNNNSPLTVIAGPYPDLNTCLNSLFNNQDWLKSKYGCVSPAACGGGSLPPTTGPGTIGPPPDGGGGATNPPQSSGGVTPNYAPIPEPSGDYTGPRSASDVISLVNTVLWWISIVFWIAAAGFIFYSAFLYLTAGGNDEKISKAHGQLKWAVVAVTIGIMTAGLPLLIRNFLAAR